MRLVPISSPTAELFASVWLILILLGRSPLWERFQFDLDISFAGAFCTQQLRSLVPPPLQATALRRGQALSKERGWYAPRKLRRTRTRMRRSPDWAVRNCPAVLSPCMETVPPNPCASRST